ncbi:hypothetical protein F5B22DRAFT_613604 [Xylaria bambusicola]|uniref:uncharacterized protein n=1 Tax=Xylaria bambusicola TaxID=326684 RepID=UPI002007ECF9|nr:uncharacterized protein F5B22DRAFT_613604 [Xylaria bambusicola]KAI0512890.1 hypothetical protein F5B22DRAFT_613604 [Xylaria bambusicola]
MSTKATNNNNNNSDGAEAVNNNNNGDNNDNNYQVANSDGTGSSATNTNTGNDTGGDNSQMSSAIGANSSAVNNNSNVGGSTISFGNSDIAATLTAATKTIYAAAIVTFVSLALQIVVLGAVLVIWLRRRKLQRGEKTGGRREKGVVSGYVHPVRYWSLPSDAQQYANPGVL